MDYSECKWYSECNGLQKLSETVRDYTYLMLTSQTSTRGPIVGHEARNLDAQ